MTNFRICRTVVLGLSFLLFWSVTAQAQEEGWQNTAAIYFVGASIDADVGIGPVNGSLDLGFDDILDNLDAGLMVAYRGDAGQWAFHADLIYLGLEKKESGLGVSGNETAKLTIDQLVFELAGSLALTDRLDVVGGARYWDLETKITRSIPVPPPGTNISGKTDDDWVDPIVGLRYEQQFAEKWTFIGRGDIGGFGVGSDFSWHITAFIGYEVFGNGNLFGGVRYLGVDYEDGSGANRFKFDAVEGGPLIGFAWAF